jgi:hypothetical protein
MAAGLAGASEASADVTIEHSAKSGELEGSRLTLRGVSGRVAYATSGGSSGTASVRWLHRRVFLPSKPATGTRHVAGHRGGGEPTFRLSKPRYNAARRTVSYRAKRLAKKRSSGSSARAAGGLLIHAASGRPRCRSSHTRRWRKASAAATTASRRSTPRLAVTASCSISSPHRTGTPTPGLWMIPLPACCRATACWWSRTAASGAGVISKPSGARTERRSPSTSRGRGGRCLPAPARSRTRRPTARAPTKTG